MTTLGVMLMGGGFALIVGGFLVILLDRDTD